MVDVKEKGKALQSYPFEARKWGREPGGDVRIHKGSSFLERLKDALPWLWASSDKIYWANDRPIIWRLEMVWHVLTEKYVDVDDVLDDDIYVTWRETADYLLLVQPLVGEVIGDFLIEEPDHPHAINIAKAIQKAEDNR